MDWAEHFNENPPQTLVIEALSSLQVMGASMGKLKHSDVVAWRYPAVEPTDEERDAMSVAKNEAALAQVLSSLEKEG